jgi:hypothetical protein
MGVESIFGYYVPDLQGDWKRDLCLDDEKTDSSVGSSLNNLAETEEGTEIDLK